MPTQIDTGYGIITIEDNDNFSGNISGVDVVGNVDGTGTGSVYTDYQGEVGRYYFEGGELVGYPSENFGGNVLTDGWYSGLTGAEVHGGDRIVDDGYFSGDRAFGNGYAPGCDSHGAYYFEGGAMVGNPLESLASTGWDWRAGGQDDGRSFDALGSRDWRWENDSSLLTEALNYRGYDTSADTVQVAGWGSTFLRFFGELGGEVIGIGEELLQPDNHENISKAVDAARRQEATGQANPDNARQMQLIEQELERQRGVPETEGSGPPTNDPQLLLNEYKAVEADFLYA